MRVERGILGALSTRITLQARFAFSAKAETFSSGAAHCLKIALMVALEMFNFDIFHQFLPYQNCPFW